MKWPNTLDKGRWYKCEAFAKLAQENGLILNMSSTGNCKEFSIIEDKKNADQQRSNF